MSGPQLEIVYSPLNLLLHGLNSTRLVRLQFGWNGILENFLSMLTEIFVVCCLSIFFFSRLSILCLPVGTLLLMVWCRFMCLEYKLISRRCRRFLLSSLFSLKLLDFLRCAFKTLKTFSSSTVCFISSFALCQFPFKFLSQVKFFQGKTFQ